MRELSSSTTKRWDWMTASTHQNITNFATSACDACSAAAPVAMMAAPGGGAAAAAPVVEEKTTFDVVLEEIPADKKVRVLHGEWSRGGAWV